MSFDYKDEEITSVLADNIIVESQPSSTPKILGTGLFPTYDAAGGTKVMASQEEGGGELQMDPRLQ